MSEASGNTALLVLHLQAPVLEMMADKGLAEKAAAVIADARKAGLPVIYASIGFRPGYPETAEDDPLREILGPHNLLVKGVSDDVVESVAPQAGDLQITAPRHSAFSGTDLEVLLRVRGIDNLVLIGASTSGVVFGTANEADDRKYGVTVLSDVTTDGDPEAHRIILGLLPTPPRRVKVMTASDWASGLAA